MFKTGMTGLIRTLGPLPGSLLKGAKAGIACDWTRPEDFVYSYQPIMDEWYSSYVFEDVGGVPTQVGERMYQEILLIGNVYRINFTVSGRTKGTIVAEAGTNQGAVRDEDGTYTDTLVCIGNTKLSFYKTADFDGEMTVVSVENLSVTEALPLKTVGSWQGSRFVQPAAANMPYYEPGKDGSPGALRFDGINDFMQHTGDQQKLHTPSGFTAAFVIEPEITAATGQRVILDQTNNNVANAGIQVVYDAANQQITTRVSNGSKWTVSGSTWLSRGIPHIVDARWDEASGLDLVVDDHSVEVVGGSGSLADTVALELGRRQGGDYFSGRVSDMVVREGRVPEKDIERWRGKMREKHSFRGKSFLEGLLEFVTTKDQSWDIQAALGSPYSIDWGDGHVDNLTGTGKIVTTAHNYALPGKYVIKMAIDPEYLLTWNPASNSGIYGQYPNLNAFPNLNSFGARYGDCTGIINDIFLGSLRTLYGDSNRFTGNLPIISGTDCRIYYLPNNMFSGNILDLGSEPVTHFRVDYNALSGTLFVSGSNVRLFYCGGNFFTDYISSAIPLSMGDFRAENNLLPQSAIDQIISDFHTNLNNRPKAGTLNLGGTGNAAPSPAAAALAQDIRDHGWTVTHN